MINVREIFSDLEEEDIAYNVTYTKIVSHFGSIEIQSHDTDYQGDSYYLLKKDNEYGYLCVSWGSCSGCDALQACNTFADLQNLVSKLEVSVVWQDSWESMLNWILARDWESKIEWHTGVKKFLKEVEEYKFRVFK